MITPSVTSRCILRGCKYYENLTFFLNFWVKIMVVSHDDVLDLQNQRLSDKLSQKVSRLKSLAFDIENESKTHVRLLDGMDDDFDGSTTLLQGSFQRLQKMVGSGRGSRRLICYMTIFMVIFFMITYYLISHSATK